MGLFFPLHCRTVLSNHCINFEIEDWHVSWKLVLFYLNHRLFRGIIVIFAYLSRLVLPVKINLLRSSIVLAGLFFLRGPIRLRALLSSLTSHETLTGSGFRSLAFVELIVVYLLLTPFLVFTNTCKTRAPMKRG